MKEKPCNERRAFLAGLLALVPGCSANVEIDKTPSPDELFVDKPIFTFAGPALDPVGGFDVGHFRSL